MNSIYTRYQAIELGDLTTSDKEEIYILFCRDMLNRIETDNWINRYKNKGLCANLIAFMYEHDLKKPYYAVSDYIQKKIYKHKNTPFNNKNNQYHTECNSGTMYENQARLNHIKRWASKEIPFDTLSTKINTNNDN